MVMVFTMCLTDGTGRTYMDHIIILITGTLIIIHIIFGIPIIILTDSIDIIGITSIAITTLITIIEQIPTFLTVWVRDPALVM